ncbi:MAG: hypothetical protein QM770_18270 [Tepidisphaeraceae bacterium]
MRPFMLFVSGVLLVASQTDAKPPEFHAAGVTLSWTGDNTHGYAPLFKADGATCAAPAEAVLFILPARDEQAQRNDLHATFDDAGEAVSTLTTPGGSEVKVVDRWTVSDDRRSFLLDRRVTVERVGTDRAFGTAFEINSPGTPRRPADAQVFIPGMWYGTQANTKPSSLIHDVGQTDFLFREDRMALPMVSVREPKSGWTLTVTHEQPDGATIVADDNIRRVIDERIRFGSLGLRRDDGLRVAFRFPGTEGEQTSIFGFSPERRTAERLHPMKAGATQAYRLSVRFAREPDFATQMRSAWRAGYARANPPVAPSDLQAVYRASIGVLDHYATDYAGAAGIPFAVALPGGSVRDLSMQMGFVGQQLPCASYLIDEGLRTKRDDLVDIGERMVDFWRAKACRRPACRGLGSISSPSRTGGTSTLSCASRRMGRAACCAPGRSNARPAEASRSGWRSAGASATG